MDADKHVAKEPNQIFMGLITRAWAECFKEQLNNLIQRIQQENSSLRTKGEFASTYIEETQTRGEQAQAQSRASIPKMHEYSSEFVWHLKTISEELW